MGTINATGKSRFMLSNGLWILEINRERASIKPILVTLLPSASPSAIPGFPDKAALTETDNSGLEVANAAIVVPIIPEEIRAQRASPTKPRTKISPPTPAKRIPIIKIT